ncbi:NIPSNAP family protein [Roseibacterium sp. SDUM158016]|uniref:NIPSNAP family protein n=1 Tax=Roseicyclus sediminis TaxID=2980997 RepID=UPI0021CFB9CE|nr:NIPSNAP family protein [Roseibacterium sp. SDUM158016]MCU4652022.1 NIPSNAP family protein [Roseibacterium sp. SDUM158016]
MIYDLRVYEHADGCADAVRERFLAEVATRFPDHGIELVGVFVDAATDRLTYLTRFADEAARAAAWASFGSDPGWQAAKKASEVKGPLVVKQQVSLLSPAMPGLPLA